MALLYNLIILLFLYISTAESADPMTQFCNQNTNISTTSRISFNINALLANLVQTTAQNGFKATSYGQDKDQIYGLAQCRADVSSKDCASCIQDAAQQIRALCPDQADARIWYDYCFLRYDPKNFLGEVDTSYGVFFANVENVMDPKAFNKELGNLVDEINAQAVVPTNKGFGKGQKKLSDFGTLYAFGQCTRDLSSLNCAQCLAVAVGNVFPGFCKDKKGCRVLYSSCYVRYELYPIFFPLDSQEKLASSSMTNYASTVYKP